MKNLKADYSEKERLELFVTRVEELYKCKFIKQMKKIGVEPTGQRSDDFFSFQVNKGKPDWESINFMLMKFRLIYAKKEPAFFFDICTILRRQTDVEELKERIDHLRATYSKVLKHGCGMGLRINGKPLVPEEIINSIFGSEFHSIKNDIDRRKYLESLLSGSLYMFFMDYITTLIQIIGELYKITRKVLGL